jgi:hypothetical protein
MFSKIRVNAGKTLGQPKRSFSAHGTEQEKAAGTRIAKRDEPKFEFCRPSQIPATFCKREMQAPKNISKQKETKEKAKNLEHFLGLTTAAIGSAVSLFLTAAGISVMSKLHECSYSESMSHLLRHISSGELWFLPVAYIITASAWAYLAATRSWNHKEKSNE